ncbi:MAG: division/cell wall cluster transcriptional repressor MraZ [Arenicella sp.]
MWEIPPRLTLISQVTTLFRGATNINLDAKGRLAIPTRYREALLRACDGRIVLTLSPRETCLWMYPLHVWEDIERKLVALPSEDLAAERLRHLLIGYADDCDMDGSGRLLIKEPLRDQAQITKNSWLIGQGNKFEIWDDELWRARRDLWLQQNVDELPASEQIRQLSL